jgi:hypothetical protein
MLSAASPRSPSKRYGRGRSGGDGDFKVDMGHPRGAPLPSSVPVPHVPLTGQQARPHPHQQQQRMGYGSGLLVAATFVCAALAYNAGRMVRSNSNYYVHVRLDSSLSSVVAEGSNVGAVGSAGDQGGDGRSDEPNLDKLPPLLRLPLTTESSSSTPTTGGSLLRRGPSSSSTSSTEAAAQGPEMNRSKIQAAKTRRPKAPIAAATVPGSPRERRTRTDAGVSLAEPELYEPLEWDGRDTSTATVMGMASGYDLKVYERFVGSLRKTGYGGHIILGVAPDVPDDVLEYFAYRNVTAKILTWVDCTYAADADASTGGSDIFTKTTCADPYPDIKIRWSRFPLQRDWLAECETCTGPVLTADVRDTFFQRNPFGPGSAGPARQFGGLQVYEEHKNMTTQHWLTEWPIGACKGRTYDEPMMCSGTTTGTRAAMIKYLEVMYEEMKVWINDPKCRFSTYTHTPVLSNLLVPFGVFLSRACVSYVQTSTATTSRCTTFCIIRGSSPSRRQSPTGRAGSSTRRGTRGRRSASTTRGCRTEPREDLWGRPKPCGSGRSSA